MNIDDNICKEILALPVSCFKVIDQQKSLIHFDFKDQKGEMYDERLFCLHENNGVYIKLGDYFLHPEDETIIIKMCDLKDGLLEQYTVLKDVAKNKFFESPL